MHAAMPGNLRLSSSAAPSLAIPLITTGSPQGTPSPLSGPQLTSGLVSPPAAAALRPPAGSSPPRPGRTTPPSLSTPFVHQPRAAQRFGATWEPGTAWLRGGTGHMPCVEGTGTWDGKAFSGSCVARAVRALQAGSLGARRSVNLAGGSTTLGAAGVWPQRAATPPGPQGGARAGEARGEHACGSPIGAASLGKRAGGRGGVGGEDDGAPDRKRRGTVQLGCHR